MRSVLAALILCAVTALPAHAAHRHHHRHHHHAHVGLAGGSLRRGIVTVTTAAGISITVAADLASRFQGLIADFVSAGYRPRHIGCFALTAMSAIRGTMPERLAISISAAGGKPSRSCIRSERTKSSSPTASATAANFAIRGTSMMAARATRGISMKVATADDLAMVLPAASRRDAGARSMRRQANG